MKTRLLPALFLAALPMLAQLPTPNSAGVSAGHEHLLMKDMAAYNKFWTALGGTEVQLGQLKMIKIPGVYIMARQGEPKGGSEGSTVEYIGIKVKNMKESLAKWEAAGIKPQPGGSAKQVFLMAPGDVKFKITEDKSLATPMASDTLKMNVPNVKEAEAWYAKYFGAKLVKHGKETVGDIPGSNILFTEVKEPVVGTQGRSLDHIGLEVKNLEALCKRMEADGIKFSRPYSKPANIPLGVAIFTDPWGTYVELNEGFASAP
jgi:catechol 2,3-dioxygenase-like lactoylglutathione lyase family enzyme